MNHASRIKLLMTIMLMPLMALADIQVSDVNVFSGYPWKEVVIGYTIKGSAGSPAALEISAKDNVSGKVYVCKTIEGVSLVAGRHVVKWNALADGAKFKSDAVVFSARILSQPLYCVIDLSGGTGAEHYPVTGLDAMPSEGWTDEYKTTKLVLRLIEPGSFKMGDSVHGGKTYDVMLTKSYYMGVFEVTQQQWELVMGTKPSSFSNSGYYATRPVETISYDMIRKGPSDSGKMTIGADSFIGKLQAKTGMRFDLPTEVQWEYACRAGTTTDYNSGKNFQDSQVDTGAPDAAMDEVGRYLSNGGENCIKNGRYDFSVTTVGGTATVGSYLPNGWGLYDMHGNVYERCFKCIGNDGVITDVEGVGLGYVDVIRGGAWNYGARTCTSHHRGFYETVLKSYFVGFRLSRTLQMGDVLTDAQNSEETLAEASFVTSVDTTFAGGTNALGSMDVAYGAVDFDQPCKIMMNDVEIASSCDRGAKTVTFESPGEYYFVYSCGVTMESAITVTHVDVNKLDVQIEKDGLSCAYDRSGTCPEVVVLDDGVRLINNVAYVLEYLDNTSIGTARVIVTGILPYVGSVTNEFTIIPKPIAVVADEKKQVYGEMELPLTYRVSGLCEGDELSGGLSRADGMNVGTYAISIGSLMNENYSIAFTPATYEIVRASYDMSSVAWSAERSFVYDGQPHGVSLLGLPVGVTATLSGHEAKDAGAYSATANFAYDAANYNAPSVAPCAWEIRKRDLVLRVADKDKSYDGYALSASGGDVSGDGYVDGETLDYYDFTTLTEMGSGTSSFSFRDSASAKASNYNVTVVEGRLRVTIGGSVYAGEVVSAKMRENDPTIMDVKYIVSSVKDAVDVRLVVFKDGVRSFANVIVPEAFANGTEANVGDGVSANTTNTVSWRVSEDWNIDLAKVKVEVLVKPSATYLPFKWVTIPGRNGRPSMKVSTNETDGNDLFNALLWCVADRDEGLVLADGVLKSGDDVLVSGTELAAEATEFIFGKMGYGVLEGEDLEYVRGALRKPLKREATYSQYAVKVIGE